MREIKQVIIIGCMVGLVLGVSAYLWLGMVGSQLSHEMRAD